MELVTTWRVWRESDRLKVLSTSLERMLYGHWLFHSWVVGHFNLENAVWTKVVLHVIRHYILWEEVATNKMAVAVVVPSLTLFVVSFNDDVVTPGLDADFIRLKFLQIHVHLKLCPVTIDSRWNIVVMAQSLATKQFIVGQSPRRMRHATSRWAAQISKGTPVVSNCTTHTERKRNIKLFITKWS